MLLDKEKQLASPSRRKEHIIELNTGPKKNLLLRLGYRFVCDLITWGKGSSRKYEDSKKVSHAIDYEIRSDDLALKTRLRYVIHANDPPMIS